MKKQTNPPRNPRVTQVLGNFEPADCPVSTYNGFLSCRKTSTTSREEPRTHVALATEARNTQVRRVWFFSLFVETKPLVQDARRRKVDANRSQVYRVYEMRRAHQNVRHNRTSKHIGAIKKVCKARAFHSFHSHATVRSSER